MSKNGYTVEECIQIVNCCYFVGSCHACPAHKSAGYANIVRCAGNKEVGQALLDILEPLHNAQRMKEPTLFDVVEAVEAYSSEEKTEEAPEEQPTDDPAENAGELVTLTVNEITEGEEPAEDEDGRSAEDAGQDLVSEDDAESDTAAAGS